MSNNSGSGSSGNNNNTTAAPELVESQFKNLTEQETRTRIWQINKENERAWHEIKEIEKHEEKNTELKIDYINAICANYERLHYLGVYKDPINTICAHVCKLAKETHKIRASPAWIHFVAERKYKQEQYTPNKFQPPQVANARVMTEEEQKNFYGTPDITPLTDTQVEEPIFEAPEESIPEPMPEPTQTWTYTADDNYGSQSSTTTPPTYIPEIIPESVIRKQSEPPKKPFDEMTPEELRAATEQALREAREYGELGREKRRRAEYALDLAKSKHIAIDPELEGKMKMPTISAKSKASGPSHYSEALRMWAACILQLADKAEKYKPSPELDKLLTELIANEIELMEPYLDEKWRKDNLSWFKIMIDEAAYGKHAAASENPTLLDNGIEAEVTREQVGDKRERQHRLALRTLAVQPRWKAFHTWYRNTQEVAIGYRKEDLHDTLSNNA